MKDMICPVMLGTYHLIDDENNGHQTKIFTLSLLAENCFQVSLKKFHDKHIMIAFLAKPENLWYTFFTLQVLQDLIFVF